jgi:hypothetical protein
MATQKKPARDGNARVSKTATPRRRKPKQLALAAVLKPTPAELANFFGAVARAAEVALIQAAKPERIQTSRVHAYTWHMGRDGRWYVLGPIGRVEHEVDVASRWGIRTVKLTKQVAVHPQNSALAAYKFVRVRVAQHRDAIDLYEEARERRAERAEQGAAMALITKGLGTHEDGCTIDTKRRPQRRQVESTEEWINRVAADRRSA